MPAVDPLLRRWPLAAFVVSATMLAIAHAFETFGHLAPCHLCLKQREVYWVALAVSGAASLLLATPWRGPIRRAAGVLLALVFAYGVYLAAWHAGAEWKWWPAPPTCSGGGQVSLKDLGALLRGGPAHAPACDQAAWVFLGLSMAGWNFLISLVLVAMSALSAIRPGKAR
jgi:disulfide bond formation protein DsbB